MPLPEHYDNFDVGDHDYQAERLEQLDHEHWLNDLRNLQSEEQAAEEERTRDEHLSSPYIEYRKEFEEANPRPDLHSPPQERAEWEYRLLEYYYERSGSEKALARHRFARGAFIEHHRGVIESAEADFEEIFGTPESRKLLPEREPAPWPPLMSDPIKPYRDKLDEVSDPDDLAEALVLRDSPAYELAEQLTAALRLGWFPTLQKEDREVAHVLADEMIDFAMLLRTAHSVEYRPGTIGSHLLRCRRGLEKAESALSLLDASRAYPWLTEAAYRVFHDHLTRMRDAAIDHYGFLKSIYDGYYERAVRILTEGKPYELPEKQ